MRSWNERSLVLTSCLFISGEEEDEDYEGGTRSAERLSRRYDRKSAWAGATGLVTRLATRHEVIHKLAIKHQEQTIGSHFS